MRAARRATHGALLAAGLMLAASSVRLPAITPAAVVSLRPGGTATPWRGADGEPLPFADDREVEAFLLAAEIVADEPIGQGITEPRKLLLERGGVRAHAVFRHHHDVDRDVRLDDGRRLAFFIDSFKGEVAAYRLSRLLGMRNVPPAVLRPVRRTDGSVQLWIEGARTQRAIQEERLASPAELRSRHSRETADMRVFDNLIDNIDRNAGNILWDERWDLWLIDHTRAFARRRDLPRAEDVARCSRRLLAGLEALDEGTLAEPMAGLLGRYELRALLERRDLLVAHIRALVAERGEAAVLFDHEVSGVGPVPGLDER